MEINLPFPATLIKRVYDVTHLINWRKLNLSKKLILIHFEEPLSNSQPAHSVIADSYLFDFIFTSDKEIIDAVDHAHWAPLAECWTNGSMPSVGRDRTSEVKEKNFSVSFLNTSKSHNGGNYQIRHDIWDNIENIKIPTNLFESNEHPSGSNYPKLPQGDKFQTSDKIHLYKSMFNICPENISGNENNFSQRLIDCFINRTIPIYRGYENIGEHFNTNAMVLINDGKDAINKINQLTPEYYNERLGAIEDNYNRCIQREYHLAPGQRIANKIIKLIKQ
jgi:hypothetical protein|tara:strand:+ start:937 stop:1770 length:834 start_codon:yes stop_codon:yes gene_type:complete